MDVVEPSLMVTDLDPHTRTAEEMLDLYAGLHDSGCPVVRSDAHGGFYLLGSHPEVKRTASDWQTFSSANGVVLPRFPVHNVAIDDDPPEHAYWRGVFRHVLGGAQVRAAEPAVRADAARLIEEFAGRGHAELVAELAAIVPGNTICRIIGVTDPERVRIGCRLGVQLAESTFDPTLAQSAVGEFAAFVFEELRARRASPGSDFLSRLANEEIDGHRLSDDEIMGLATGIFIAGHHTTTAGLASLFHAVAIDAGIRDRLIADRSLIARAAEEAVRLETPLHGFHRTTTADVEIQGCPIPAGSQVWLNYQAANRDPKVFDDPSRFSLDRRPNPQIAYGYGIHTCIGAALARMEMRVVTDELLTRLPDLSSTGEPVARRWGGGLIMSIDRVAVTFTPPSDR